LDLKHPSLAMAGFGNSDGNSLRSRFWMFCATWNGAVDAKNYRLVEKVVRS